MYSILLIIYHALAKHLPPTYYPGGRLFRTLRSTLCGPLFKDCGVNITIEPNATVAFRKVTIGDNSGIGLNAWIGAASIGRNVMMAPDVVILSTNHEFRSLETPMRSQGNAGRIPSPSETTFGSAPA
jgi:hypothetical protein